METVGWQNAKRHTIDNTTADVWFISRYRGENDYCVRVNGKECRIHIYDDGTARCGSTGETGLSEEHAIALAMEYRQERAAREQAESDATMARLNAYYATK